MKKKLGIPTEVAISLARLEIVKLPYTNFLGSIIQQVIKKLCQIPSHRQNM